MALASSEPITSLRITRFTGRAEGELVLGPFRAHGIVKAIPVGHGDFSCEVAQDYWSGYLLDAGQVTGGYSEGSIHERGQRVAPVRAEGGMAWSAARLLTDLPGPLFHPDVAAGTVLTERTEIDVQNEEPKEAGFRYWGGLEEWARLSGRRAPAFDPDPGMWTYVWGSAAGPIGRSLDFRTGRPTDPGAPGFHLIKSPFPDEVDITGDYMRGLSSIEGKTLRPGRYLRARPRYFAPGVLVRIRGRGQLRALDLVERRRAPWPGRHREETRRIDLASLSTGGPGSAGPAQHHTAQKLYRA